MNINQINTNKSIHFISLGCSKNLVDSEVMLGVLHKNNFKHTEHPDNADIIVINTCSFVEAAKKESVDMILEMADYKLPHNGKCRALVVAGCLAQGYSNEIKDEIPEIDLIIGTGEYHKINEYLFKLDSGNLKSKIFVSDKPTFIHDELSPRLITTPKYSAWLKISEGCDRLCTFCIIPKLRGNLRSRTVESLITETTKLVSNGVKEINLISQDLSQYGSDLDESNNLYNLLDALEKIEGLKWIRLFYFYPDDLNSQIIKKIATSQKICKYLDMPVQHFSNNVLKKMNRSITGNEIIDKINNLKQSIPDIFLRTSIIVGFPGETDEDIKILEDNIKHSTFHHLGVFKYSDEVEAASYNLNGKIPKKEINKRYNKIYKAQKLISKKLNDEMVGKTVEVLIEGFHEETDLLIQGRHQGQAPDIDGKVIINDMDEKEEINIGDFVQVEITESLEYDLIGKIIK